jgi:ABC-2 type transport system permease protein
MLRSAVTVAGAELRRRFRSRSALITSFVAPLAMAIVFGLMLGGTDSASFAIGAVDGGSTPQSAAITSGLVGGFDPDGTGEADGAPSDQGGGEIVFSSFATVGQAEAAVEDGDVGAAIVVGDDIDLTVIINPSSPISGQVAQSIASRVATSLETGGAPPVQLEPVAIGGRELSASAFFGASMAILLLFFSTGLAAQSILEDKENRTLDRMLAGPTTLWSILIGKVAAVAAMAVAGFITVWLVTTLVFGATWGSPVAVLVLIVFTIFALAGVAMFIGGLASTSQQAITLTAVVTFALSLIGGNFTGPADTPATLRAIRGVTPNGRALEAFTELSVDAASVSSIVSTLVVLFAFGLVFGAIGLTSVSRRLSS